MIPTAAARRDNGNGEIKVAPGVYRVDGEVQIRVPELLEALGISDEPETREEMVKIVKESMIESGLIAADEVVETVAEHEPVLDDAAA